MAQLRIFSYLPNPRIWKATIAARLNGVELEIKGAAPKELQSWLWDFDARPLSEDEREASSGLQLSGRTGFKGRLFKTAEFLAAHPFGTVPAPGTCTLNFYGAGAPTPSTGVAAPGGTQASGTTNAFLLSSVAAGFQGYVIAQCNYQFGHGFAFIAQNLGQPAGSTMGYLALELERAGLGSETLGQ